MKKIRLTLACLLFAVSMFAQKEETDMVKNANQNLSVAQKATIEWVKMYDLDGDQARAALAIQFAFPTHPLARFYQQQNITLK